MKSICLCIDDYGMNVAINDATIRLVASGRIHAVSCMSSMPSWASASRMLHDFDPHQLDVGLHLNLTEPPNSNRFGNRLSVLIAKTYTGQLPHKAIAIEVSRQFDEFERALGRLPDFVDGHQHVHQLPGVRDIVLDIVEARYHGQRPWLRSTKPRKPKGRAYDISLKQRVIYALGGRQFDRAAASLNCEQNQGLIGVYGFRGSTDQYLDRLSNWFSICQEGDLLMCHPACTDDVSLMVRGDSILSARLREYSALMSDDFLRLLHTASVQMKPLSRIGTTSDA